jgi:hypothetical protein
MHTTEILVLYYSRNGKVRQMAHLVARGIEQIPDTTARIRTVPRVSAVSEAVEPCIPSPPSKISSSAQRLRLDLRRASATWLRP